MIYGYVSIDNHIKCNIDTDYIEEPVSDVKKVRLFLSEKDRDASLEAERISSKFNNDIEKFNTKSEQGKLIIISQKEYYYLKKELERLRSKLNK